ncbi:uncharacterized protein LOC126888099 [Diabrotica virgifera virgifera]|uniref:PHD-type domain-containing protein n=1 Tax=Diabrotica virgifera virgifera TaxID=50390 RepID=A0ABM5KPG3_DIAVI|nr:uncharacterized protein LOC126888099 [Diabrotica virgifera virgifera]
MPICVLCTQGVTGKSPGLKCCGGCQEFYHAKCVGLTKSDVSRFQTPGLSWTCTNCRGTVDKRRSVIVADEDSDDFPLEETSSSQTLKVLHSIQKDMASMNIKYGDLLQSVNFCSDSITTFENTISILTNKIKEIEKLTKENLNLRDEVKVLNSRVDTLEQQLRANDVEICGVPFIDNENVLKIVSEIGSAIDLPITEGDVDSFYRSSTFRTDLPNPIIVKFSKKIKKDAFLAAAKAKRRQNGSFRGLKIANISDQLYVNEHLTPKNKKLLRDTKLAAKSKQYKYIWTRNCVIFVRKDDRSQIIKISCDGDIEKLD